MSMRRMAMTCLVVGAVMAPSSARAQGAAGARPAVIDLWSAGKTAFGVFVPDENPAPRGPTRGPAVYTVAGGQALAANPLIDYVFLNLEGTYDRNAVMAISDAHSLAGRRRPAGDVAADQGDPRDGRRRHHAAAHRES